MNDCSNISNYVYLDNNANTQMSLNVQKAIFNTFNLGNASSHYPSAKRSALIIDKFKNLLQNYFGADYKILITSGGSESNSTAINNFVFTAKFPHIICSTIEHPSITEHLLYLEKNKKALISWIYPDEQGFIHPQLIKDKIKANTKLIILQHVNSETGTIQPVDYVYNNIAAPLNIPLHCDMVQSFAKIEKPLADSYSASFHKLNGPIGIGFLAIKSALLTTPLIFGHQNDNFRGGTYNTPLIAGALQALETYYYDFNKMQSMRNYLINELIKNGVNVKTYLEYYDSFKNINANNKVCVIITPLKYSIPHTLLISIPNCCGIKIKEQLFNKSNIVVSNGSACNSINNNIIGSIHSAPIINCIKMGLIRISFGSSTKKSDIDKFIKCLIKTKFN